MDATLTIRWGNLGLVQPDLETLVAFLGPGDFPEYARAAEEVAENAERLYRGYCLGEPTPSGRALQRPSGALARSIRRESTDLLLWALRNESPYAEGLEQGFPDRDLKKSLPTAPKARRAKDGSLYLIIPLRHGVPGTRGLSPMLTEVYRLARVLQHSRVLGAPSLRTSATGVDVPRFAYRWNGPLSAQALAAAGHDAETTGRYQGLVRMGRKGHTTYLTFRVMSQKSPAGSWIRPATPGLWPMRWAVEVAWSEGTPRLEEALEADLLGILEMD
ncbi:MAG: hypothetical protein HYZ13_09155 [Acidobacteria bacterium]|nr:hypothetical protein [Acidobacteriota bacterium]